MRLEAGGWRLEGVEESLLFTTTLYYIHPYLYYYALLHRFSEESSVSVETPVSPDLSRFSSYVFFWVGQFNGR